MFWALTPSHPSLAFLCSSHIEILENFRTILLAPAPGPPHIPIPLVLSTLLPLHSYVLLYLASSNLSITTQLKWSLLWQHFPNLIPHHEQCDFVFFYDLWENKTKPYNNYNYCMILSGIKLFLNQTNSSGARTQYATLRRINDSFTLLSLFCPAVVSFISDWSKIFTCMTGYVKFLMILYSIYSSQTGFSFWEWTAGCFLKNYISANYMYINHKNWQCKNNEW